MGVVNLLQSFLAKIVSLFPGFINAEPPPEDNVLLNELFTQGQKEELQLVFAFKRLVNRLPENIRNMDPWLRFLPTVSENIQKDISAMHFTDTGRPYTDILAKYGLTPLSLYHTACAIASVCKQLQHEDLITVNRNMAVFKTRSVHNASIAETRGRAECTAAQANAMIRWILSALENEPFLIPGFEANVHDKEIRIYPNPSNKGYVWGMTAA